VAFKRKEFADECERLNAEENNSNPKLAAVNRQLSELLRLKEQQLIDELASHPAHKQSLLRGLFWI
jgi:hypothetical protein